MSQQSSQNQFALNQIVPNSQNVESPNRFLDSPSFGLRRRSTIKNGAEAQDETRARRHRARASSDVTWSKDFPSDNVGVASLEVTSGVTLRRGRMATIQQSASSSRSWQQNSPNDMTSVAELGLSSKPVFDDPFNNPRNLLLRRNPFCSDEENGEDVRQEEKSEKSTIWSNHSSQTSADDPVVQYHEQATLQNDAEAMQEEERLTDIAAQRIVVDPPTQANDFPITGTDYVYVEDPKDPARILNRRDLHRQRIFFLSLVLSMNLAALLGAIFAGGTWVFGFILFIKSKDTISVLISACGLLVTSIWRLFRPPKPVGPKWILSLIPAYSESEEQIVKTILSLRDNGTEPHLQVMCVILDGKHRDVVKHMRVIKSFHRPYVTSKFKKGELTIDAGFIDNVPVICLEKVQNSGKKDSLILCHDIFNVIRDNAPLYTKLLRKEIWTSVLPALTVSAQVPFRRFDMIFCTDADSTIYKGAISSLANAIARNSRSIAACGLVLVELEPGYEWSRWNLYQQFQYTFGQYVRRRAESMYGKITCLPGCITMCAVRPEMSGAIRKYAEPITAYPVILHQVQYLGTDRRLTYCMLSQNKRLQTLFVPEAISETVAPQSLQHYLSQRRRWGSNAYFNNFFFCFGEKMVLLTRLAAAVELFRLTMVYYRIANTLIFVVSLSRTDIKLMRIVPLLVISQLPAIWFAFCAVFLESELRKRAFKLFLGFGINKLMSPLLAMTIFTKVLKNLGSQVWGMTGGNPTPVVASSSSLPAGAGPSHPTALPHGSTTTVQPAEPPVMAFMETLLEGGLGEPLAKLSEDEILYEELNEKAGIEDPIPPFG